LSKFLFLLFFAIAAFGYDELLLDAQSSVLPKIALLDKGISNKLILGKIVIVIAHTPEDSEIAKEVASKMMLNNQPKAGGYGFKVVMVEFSHLAKSDMSILYILNGSDMNIKKAAFFARQKGVISFVYDKADLSNGAILSMSIERSAIIMLKKSAMRDAGVQFADSFYKIVRVVE